MFLKHLALTNYRSYEKLAFDFEHNLTIFIGENAQGKSNLLESIFYLATLKSLKAERDEELILSGTDYAHIEGEVQIAADAPETVNLQIALSLEQQLMNGRSLKKRIKINGVPRRGFDYVGNLLVVLFAPEDINLITGSPSVRRNHLDLILSQVDREYKRNLSSYSEVIVRRNRVLKNIQEGIAKKDELDFWSQRLLEFGTPVSQKRRLFFDAINQTSRSLGNYQLVYQESVLSQDRLQEYGNKELWSATSLIGPHRDDYHFELNGKDMARFGSRGEQRTAVLDFKVAQVGFIEKEKGVRPLLLLDDIFSELDDAHKAHVLGLVPMQQTIIAAVELDAFITRNLPIDMRIYEVKHGTIGPG